MVRGTSPILSMVPEDRSRVGEVARSQVVFTIPFRRVHELCLPLRVRKIQLRRLHMSKRPRVSRSKPKSIAPLMVVNHGAAGIDAGSDQHWVSVPEDRDEQPVRAFGTFTEDL